MGYEILPHTAEIGIAAWGSSRADALSEAVRGLAAILCDAEPPPGMPGPVFDVGADDGAGLLAAVLDEALYLADAHGVLAVGCEARVSDWAASGRMLVGPGDAIRTQIKAVTYHQLAFELSERGWRAQAYFDV